ncbi:MAG: class I SAM-dependent methyltransferase [Vulcanimicrobiota bacterium]
MEIGKYHDNPALVEELTRQRYAENSNISLPAEYEMFVKKDLLRFLIRLARYKFVARMLSPTDRVLEVGSGSGLGAQFLSQHCESVLGLEVKDYEVDEAKTINRRDNVEFRLQDLYDFSSDEPFDVAVCLDVIEHMPVEEGRRLLRSMVGHLRPDSGMLVVGSPSIHSYPYQSEISRASHVKCYDQDELGSLITEVCYRVLPFSMNDEMLHTGHPKMSWYYVFLGVGPKKEGAK